MVEENIRQEFRLKKIDETRNNFLEEIEQNELRSKNYKKVCTTLNYISTLSYFTFYNYWMYFNFCFCFFDLYSYRMYKLCNRIENLCNNCRN